MARPYSLDLRERVAARVAAGESCRAVAALFGRRPLVLAEQRSWLLARIAAKPDLTLRAIAAELAERGVAVSHGAIWMFFAREKISFKKKPARRRAKPRRRGAPAHPVEEIPGPA